MEPKDEPCAGPRAGVDCEEAVHRLYSYLDGELTPDRREVIRLHLDACHHCLEAFEFDGSKVFRASWMIGAVLVVAMTAMTVTMAVLFNLISDLLGGVRVTVLEEEVVLRRAQTAVAAPAPEPPPDAAGTNGG